MPNLSPQQYTQKDLGYPRTATDAKFIVTMPDGSSWAVPVQVIADNRDEAYGDEREDTVFRVRKCGMDPRDLKEWAENDMNWDEVEPYAQQVSGPCAPDFQEGWTNGEKEIKGAI